MTAAALNRALGRAEADSPFLRTLIARHEGLTGQLSSGDIQGALLVARAIDPEMPVATALRLAKARLALVVAIGDLAGVLSLEDVMAELSAFADIALDHAIRAAIESLTPGEESRGFAAIALGKHGSQELNYSSDIDLVFVSDVDSQAGPGD